MHQQLIEVLAYAMLLTVRAPARPPAAASAAAGCAFLPASHARALPCLSLTMRTPSATHPPPRQGNHIYTSGATGTNAAVIRGALRAEQPDLLTVVLPQSRSKQPAESRELLEQVGRGGGQSGG